MVEIELQAVVGLKITTQDFREMEFTNTGQVQVP